MSFYSTNMIHLSNSSQTRGEETIGSGCLKFDLIFFNRVGKKVKSGFWLFLRKLADFKSILQKTMQKMKNPERLFLILPATF